MPGLSPWKQPSSTTVTTTWGSSRRTASPPWARITGSREAVGVAGGVAALQVGLVRPVPAEGVAVREEPLVEGDPAARGVDVGLHHPGADAAGVELVVPGAGQRVGPVDPGAVAAD